jgi:hypothetical protein
MWRGDNRILTPDAVARRAGGRRRYNAWRSFRAEYRRLQVARLLRSGIRSRTAIALRLRVSTSTICRDIQHLLTLREGCPTCGRPWEKRGLGEGEAEHDPMSKEEPHAQAREWCLA